MMTLLWDLLQVHLYFVVGINPIRWLPSTPVSLHNNRRRGMQPTIFSQRFGTDRSLDAPPSIFPTRSYHPLKRIFMLSRYSGCRNAFVGAVHGWCETYQQGPNNDFLWPWHLLRLELFPPTHSTHWGFLCSMVHSLVFVRFVDSKTTLSFHQFSHKFKFKLWGKSSDTDISCLSWQACQPRSPVSKDGFKPFRITELHGFSPLECALIVFRNVVMIQLQEWAWGSSGAVYNTLLHLCPCTNSDASFVQPGMTYIIRLSVTYSPQMVWLFTIWKTYICECQLMGRHDAFLNQDHSTGLSEVFGPFESLAL